MAVDVSPSQHCDLGDVYTCSGCCHLCCCACWCPSGRVDAALRQPCAPAPLILLLPAGVVQLCDLHALGDRVMMHVYCADTPTVHAPCSALMRASWRLELWRQPQRLQPDTFTGLVWCAALDAAPALAASSAAAALSNSAASAACCWLSMQLLRGFHLRSPVYMGWCAKRPT
jgi:hypothetical protein